LGKAYTYLRELPFVVQQNGLVLIEAFLAQAHNRFQLDIERLFVAFICCAVWFIVLN
jgi:hypothetical protein